MAKLNRIDTARSDRRRKSPAFESLARDRSLVETGNGIMAAVRRLTHMFPHIYNLVVYSTFNVPGKIQAIPAPPHAATSVAVFSSTHPTATSLPGGLSLRTIECALASA